MSITLKEATIGFVAALLAGLLVLAAERYLDSPNQQSGTIFYQIASSTIAPEMQEELGTGKASELKSIFVSRIDFYNMGNKELVDFELALPGLSPDRKSMFGMSADEVILAESFGAKSVDDNGVLRLKVKKFDKWQDFNITIVSSLPVGVYKVESITQGISAERLSSIGFTNSLASASVFPSIFLFIAGLVASFAAFVVISQLVKRREGSTTTNG